MMTTIEFRRAIRTAMIANCATFKHSYTDKVRKGGFADGGPRKVCFCQVAVQNDLFRSLSLDVAKAGGRLTGVYQGMAGYVYCNIRGVCLPR